ncbi:MAG: fibronectin type III domain-containing protein, partial [Fimbriimonadaceae bacterium]
FERRRHGEEDVPATTGGRCGNFADLPTILIARRRSAIAREPQHMGLSNLTDAELEAYADNFAAFADANAAALGLSPAQVAELQSLAAGYKDDRLAQTTSHDAARAATETKNASERALVAQIGTYAGMWRANPALPESLLLGAGIQRRKRARHRRPLFAPTGFAIQWVRSHKVRLVWNRNGNESDTLFVIETRTGVDPTWTVVGVTMRKSYDYLADSVAQPVTFRVTAMRGSRRSEPSEGRPVAFGDLTAAPQNRRAA